MMTLSTDSSRSLQARTMARMLVLSFHKAFTFGMDAMMRTFPKMPITHSKAVSTAPDIAMSSAIVLGNGAISFPDKFADIEVELFAVMFVDDALWLIAVGSGIPDCLWQQ